MMWQEGRADARARVAARVEEVSAKRSKAPFVIILLARAAKPLKAASTVVSFVLKKTYLFVDWLMKEGGVLGVQCFRVWPFLHVGQL